MPLQVELLVVLVRVGKAAVARGDGVVRARLDLHVVRRVGVDQMDRRAVEQPVHVFGLAAVAAEQAVVAKNPEIAGLRRRFVGRRRARRPDRRGLHCRSPIEQLGQLVLVETQAATGRSSRFCRSCSSIGSRSKSHSASVVRLVVGDPIGLDLGRRQIFGDVDRHLFQAQLLRRLPARVADDDHAVGIDDDRLAEAEFTDGRATASTASSLTRGLFGIGLDVETFSAARSSSERTLSTGLCAGGSEQRSAAPAIQGGGQADQRNRLPLVSIATHSTKMSGVRHVPPAAGSGVL